MKIGIDLVKITEQKNRFSGDLTKVFTEYELNLGGDRLAGTFAAKEAFFKAFGCKDDWLSVWIEHETSGKPILRSILLKENEKAEVSISYAGDYVTAVVIIF